MGYSIKIEHVIQNKQLLEAIESTLLDGKVFIIKPVEAKTVSQIAFQIRNVFKCAEHFPELGFGHLSSQITIGIKPHGVELRPRYGFAKPKVLSELDVISALMNEPSNFVTYIFLPSDRYEEATLRDVLEEDWDITELIPHDDGNVTIHLSRKNMAESISAFSVLGKGASSEDFDDYIQRLTEGESDDSSGSDDKTDGKTKRRQATRKPKKVK